MTVNFGTSPLIAILWTLQMLNSVKIVIKAFAVLLFVTGCTTRTLNLQNQVTEDEEALTKITAESVNGASGLFHVIARAVLITQLVFSL